MDNDFDNVTWSNESTNRQADPSDLPTPRPTADPIDLAGISSGALDCEVGLPLKEGSSKDAYISYLVTTHVSGVYNLHSYLTVRPISSHFRNQKSRSGDGLQISYSCSKAYQQIIQHAACHLYQTDNVWSTFGEIDLGQTLPTVEHIR